MITYLKQLLCGHRFQENKKELLGQESNIDYLTNTVYIVFAIHKKCIKCNKRVIEIRRKIIKFNTKYRR